MPSLRHEYAKQIILEYHTSLSHLPQFQPRATNAPVKIGVIGAGASGLCVALMLDWLQEKTGLKEFTYDLLEANPDPIRIGGRMFTYHFSPEAFDYYDVGAMRFPDLPWMRPLFDLMSYLNINIDNGLRTPYILSTDQNILYYNDRALTQAQVRNAYERQDFNPFKTTVELNAPPDIIIDGVIGDLKRTLARDWAKGWSDLMQLDMFSTRMFMSIEYNGRRPLTQAVISYLETVDMATGLYDCALSETVLDSLDFDYPGRKIDWFSALGGADLIASRAIEKLSQQVQRGQRVTAIAPSKLPGSQSITGVDLTINGTKSVTYDHVISTMPLSCLNMVDTSKCGFSWELRSAIRELRCDASVKVAIKFSERWWQALPSPQLGGVSTTDRPTRTVVYPSYGIDTPNAPGTIIVSYTWCQDALRMGSSLQGTTVSQHMLDAILKDLTDMHQIGDPSYLRSLMISHHAWDWYSSEYSTGAFAMFGPGQFRTLYPHVTQPAFGRLHFAGEATSVHYAWVVGAVNSAFRCLSQVLMVHGREDLIAILMSPGSPFREAGTYELPSELIANQVSLGLAQARHL